MFTITARHLSRSAARGGGAVVAKACSASSAAHFSTASVVASRSSAFTPSGLANDAKLPTSIASRRLFASAPLKESYDNILVERRFPKSDGGDDDVTGGGVGVVTLHRPKALNALSDALFEDLIHAVRAFDADEEIGCIVITGRGKAFAAGEWQSFLPACNCAACGVHMICYDLPPFMPNAVFLFRG